MRFSKDRNFKLDTTFGYKRETKDGVYSTFNDLSYIVDMTDVTVTDVSVRLGATNHRCYPRQKSRPVKTRHQNL